MLQSPRPAAIADGRGPPDASDAVQRTFDEIQDEVYTISDLHLVCASPDCAVVRYGFHWVGYTNGERREGQGPGINAIIKRNGRWRIIHEHLSV